VGEIMVKVPEGLPLEDLKKKIDTLIKEEEAKQELNKRSKEKSDISQSELKEMEEPIGKTWKEDRKRILEKYRGTIKLDRPVSLEEILDLEEDTWLY
jgi:hypothetical protein